MTKQMAIKLNINNYEVRRKKYIRTIKVLILKQFTSNTIPNYRRDQNSKR